MDIKKIVCGSTRVIFDLYRVRRSYAGVRNANTMRHDECGPVATRFHGEKKRGRRD